MAIKVTVGQTTFVKKIVVGTPVSTAIENLSLDAFTDFNVATKSDGQILVYDSSESAFKNFDFVTDNGLEKLYTPGNDKLLIRIDSSSTPVVTGLSTQGNIVPTADSSFDLGDSEKKFKDLYLSGGTIHLGGIDLKDSNGTFGAKDSTGAAVNFDLSGSIPQIRNMFTASGDLSYDANAGQFSFDVEDVYTKANFDSDFNIALDSAALEGVGLTYDNATNTLAIDSAELESFFKQDIRGYFTASNTLNYDNATGDFSLPQPLDSAANPTFLNITSGTGSHRVEIIPSTSTIQSNANPLRLKTTNIAFPVLIYHNDRLSLQTLTTGVDINGQITADSATITNITLPDNGKIKIGNDSDLKIYHDGNHSVIEDAGTGSLQLKTNNLSVQNASGAENQITALSGGAVTLFHNNISKLATTVYGTTVTGTINADSSTFTNINIPHSTGANNGKIIFGDGIDDGLTIHHSTKGKINNYEGDLDLTNFAADKDILITGDNGAGGTARYFRADGSTGEVRLYHYGSQKLNTTAYGATVTGTLNADSGTFTNLTRAATVDSATYGSATQVPILTVNTSGFIDSIGTVTVAGVSSVAFDSATYNYTINTADGGVFTEMIHTRKPGLAAGTHGSATKVPIVTVNQYGLVDSIATADVAGVSSTSFDSASGIFTINTADGSVFNTIIADSNFTNHRSRLALSGGTGVTYNNANGQISIGQPVGLNDSVSFSHINADSATLTNIKLPDNGKATFGNDSDFKIYHDGSNSYIDNNKRHIYIRTNVDGPDGGDIFLEATAGVKSLMAVSTAGTWLYYDGDHKIKTIPTGVQVYGTVDADSATLNGKITTANSGAYSSKDTSGTIHRLLHMGGDNNTYVNQNTRNNEVRISTNGTQRVRVTNYGATVFGAITVDSATLTNITADSAVITDISGNTLNYTSVNTPLITGPANLVIDPATVGDNTGTVQILGNLQVEGTQTVINSTTVSINDKNIVLADSAANAAAADGAGLTINGAGATLTYAASGDKFVFNKPFQGQYLGFDSDFDSALSTKTTTNITEGNNLYFTNERVDDRVNALLIGGTNITVTYNDSNNTLRIDGNAGPSGFNLSANNTDDLSEGTSNLYYTDARVQAVSLDSAEAQAMIDSNFTNMDIDLHLPDDKRITFGNDSDLEIFHNGNHSIIRDGGTGNLELRASTVRIANVAGTKDGIIATQGGSVELYHNDSARLETTSTGITVTGTTNAGALFANGSIGNNQSAKGVYLGLSTGNDPQIALVGDNVNVVPQIDFAHDVGIDYDIRFILQDTGNRLSMKSHGNETIADFFADGAVELRHDNSKKFETTAYGATVTGTINADSATFSGDVTFDSAGALLYDVSDKKLKFGDNHQITFGNSGSGFLQHTGSNMQLGNVGASNIQIIQYTNNADVIIYSDDGSGLVTEYFRADGSTGEAKAYHYGAEKFKTSAYGVTVTGTMNADSATVLGGTLNFDSASDATRLKLNAVNTFGGNILNVQNDKGYVQVGPANNAYSHFLTDRTRYYFNKKLIVDEGIVSSYDENLQLQKSEVTKVTINDYGATVTGTINADSSTVGGITTTSTGSASVISKNGALNIRGNWIRLQSPTGVDMGIFKPSGEVELYHNGIKQFETTSTGASIRPDSDDVGLVVGRAHIGHTVHNDWAAFAHYDNRDAQGGYALLANASGRTILNAATGQDLQFRRNNVDIATFETNGDLTLEHNLTIDNHIDMGHDSARLTSTTQTEIASFSASTFTGGKFLVTAHDHVAGSRQISELLVLRDSAAGTAIATEYGQIYTDSSIATYEVDINSGNVRLLATSATANATTYQVAETLMRE